MAADDSLQTISLQLYNFLCQHIVGTAETVKTKRLMNSISDNVASYEHGNAIVSGSFGEGLELKGSDLDVMLVQKLFVVQEDNDKSKLDPNKINLVMEMNATKPGFTQLRYLGGLKFTCLFVNRDNEWYLSSELYKLYFKNECSNKLHEQLNIHGPCVSDKYERMDLAACLHNPHWIQAADNWISRGHTSWPSSDVKSDIIDHGILFVPIGSTESVNEALEWRISFSVAEKLLIYSFSHTQLRCYALMKILLKDVIDSNNNCKSLLCSYFIKSIVFWVSEETPVTEWKPENLIKCFMRCFTRLLYCVEYLICPHYFIPIINMFENKIDEQAQKLLLEHLNTLYSLGWRSLLFSDQFQNVTFHLSSSSEMNSAQFRRIINSNVTRVVICTAFNNSASYSRSIYNLNLYKSSFIKLIFLRFLSAICSTFHQRPLTPCKMNKLIYSQQRKQLAYLLQNIHHDAICGWLILATFFYKTNQYRKTLDILSYAMTKCTSEIVHLQEVILQPQLHLTTSTYVQRLGILRVLKLLDVKKIEFTEGSTLIPEELALDCSLTCYFPPVVFSHFLCFLCHYHLKDIQKCYNCIINIELTIYQEYFITNSYDKGQSYYLLGVALQLMGEKDLAFLVLYNATQWNSFGTTAAEKRLSRTYIN